MLQRRHEDAAAWHDLLEELSNLQDDLVDTADSLELAHFELACALDDVRDQLDELRLQSDKCKRRLARLRVPSKADHTEDILVL